MDEQAEFHMRNLEMSAKHLTELLVGVLKHFKATVVKYLEIQQKCLPR